MKQPDNINAYVLAGGKSTRMGTDKGLVLHRGKSFISHITDVLRSRFKFITVISNTANYNSLGFPVIEDLIKDKGPLAGIYTGLKHSPAQYNLFVSCDIPLLNNDLITFLLSKFDYTSDASVVIYNNKVEPLCGIYNKRIAGTIESLLEQNELSVIKALQHFNVQYIDISEVCKISPYVLTNINSKVELTEIEQKLNGKS